MDIHDKKKTNTTLRLLALDIVRGYAMLLMLISHSSWWIPDLDYGVAYGWDNMIVPSLTLPESLLGFVLQLATPTFFLLTGFSIALFVASRYRRGWHEWHITRFLLIRGVLLIALDLTVINFRFTPPYYGNHMAVLTGIGICVCFLAWLRRLDLRILIGIMLVVLLGTQVYFHNLIIGGQIPDEEMIVRSVFLTPSVADITWKTQFPALPWLPVVLLGYVIGSQVARQGASLTKLAFLWGMGCLILFAGLMIAGIGSLYPDHPLIFSKHPPDIDYISLYTGIAFLLIALHTKFDKINTAPFFKAVTILGQTALFFYVIHIRLIEVTSPLIAPLPLSPIMQSLLIVLAVLPILILICAGYRSYKRKHPDSLLQYL